MSISVSARARLLLRALPLLVASGMASLLLVRTHRTNGALEFPLDDAYIYLQLARQLAEGHLYQYVSSEGWTAGSTSPLYPFLLAPIFWVFQAPEAGVIGALTLSTLLYLGSVAVATRLGERLGSSHAAGTLAGTSLALSGAYTWGALSGLEIPFFTLTTLATSLGLARACFPREDETAVTPVWLAPALLGLSLARPEGFGLATLAVGILLIHPTRRRDLHAWLTWPLLLLPYLAVGLGNLYYSGQLAPNTAVHKSILYAPDLTAQMLLEHLLRNVEKLLGRLFPRDLARSVMPLGAVGLLLATLWLSRESVRAVKTRMWKLEAWLLLAVLAGSGASLLGPGPGQFARYHHTSIALLACCSGVALLKLLEFMRNTYAPGLGQGKPERLTFGAALGLTLVLGLLQAPGWSRFYADSSAEIHQQQVRLAKWISENLPQDARLLLNDAGALAYYPQRPVIDLCGLVTNRLARAYRQGSGALFEALEHLPPERQPTHAALYPGWFELKPLLGQKRTEARLQGRRLVAGGQVMELFEVERTRLGSGSRPSSFPAAKILDEVDVADLESESVHGYALLPHAGKPGSHTETFLKTAPSSTKGGIVLDGGRPIRAGERFFLESPPGNHQQLILRVGGARALTLELNGRALPLILPQQAKGQDFVEVALPLDSPHPARLEITLKSPSPYQSFHVWLVENAPGPPSPPASL